MERVDALPRGDSSRRAYADAATVELVCHSVLETTYLHPAVRARVADADTIVARGADAHARIEALLEEWESRALDDPGFDRILDQLLQKVRRRLANQEEHLFHRLRNAYPAGTLNELGTAIRQARKQCMAQAYPSTPDVPAAPGLPASDDGLVSRTLTLFTELRPVRAERGRMS
ncbi:hemerythrin domain-containing protein [Streptomyces armeniacus]|uniref:hemerythrin domain-containing protein n=1 Tax=Streptomyces armeniacus TaxID=83291 RepID=UPI001AD80E0F|nr:hemerythrin domain-containing protein [Streptomyces armeniacus]